ncbi:T9SS type A sorting domain-containing protein [Hymenobacter actinosclerus]|uniref:Por secretion system C-terminal sorting domain-containing protein n=1 Tax=Hymenobacter actinosclerus TaxID=82805 RepID=A0A1I0GQ91_9BACT|nr:T9SS type A sorting domain-containing protein [Hymenobacter actinosclerus]SET73248.1 Por secretion system C-terminal sorting domain-containing protein [Hymenobacter actinosclerus]
MQHAYTSSNRFRSLLGLALGLAATAATAQTVTPVSFNGTTPYTQNFDGMGTAGMAYPAGWGAVRLGGSGTNGAINAPLDLSVTAGEANSGGTYNVGSTNDPDRALGSIGSGSTIPAFGAAFTNGSAAAVTSLTISFRTEQWKSGSRDDQNEILAFEYSLDATNLYSGTWTAVPALDVKEVANSNTGGTPLDGNAAANSANVTGSISGLSWAAGKTMWIRFKDADNAGTDALLAVDDFSLRAGTATGVKSALNAGNVLVYPNPTADQLTIRVAGRTSKAAVTVTDLLGRTVLKGSSDAAGNFSLRTLPAGNYVVLVQDGATLTSHKISKQ